MAYEKPLRFTRHARNRMRWRGVSAEDVELCIKSPDRTEQSTGYKVNAWREQEDKLLRVTYRIEGDTILVITVVKKRLTRG